MLIASLYCAAYVIIVFKAFKALTYVVGLPSIPIAISTLLSNSLSMFHCSLLSYILIIALAAAEVIVIAIEVVEIVIIAVEVTISAAEVVEVVI